MKLLYVAGQGRSGSTLLDNLLGTIPGFVGTGELHELWRRWLEGKHCGCGEELPSCDFWSQVMDLVLSAEGALSPQEMMHWQDQCVRTRTAFLSIVGDRLKPADAPGIAQLRKLYESIQLVSGAEVVIDSSKRPARLLPLKAVGFTTFHVVHLVRDPRATAYSWRRRSRRDPYGDDLPTASVVQSGAYWLAFNVLTEALGDRLQLKVSLLRYEDFIREPTATLSQLSTMMGVKTSVPFDGGGSVLPDNHTVAGNPSRHVRGKITIDGDDEWRTGQPMADRALSTALALPMLRRYGYSLTGRSLAQTGVGVQQESNLRLRFRKPREART